MTNTLPSPVFEHTFRTEETNPEPAVDERAVVEALIAHAIEESASRSTHLVNVNELLAQGEPTFYKWKSKQEHYFYWPKGNAGNRYLLTIAEPATYQVYLHLGQFSREMLTVQPTLVDAVVSVNAKEKATPSN